MCIYSCSTNICVSEREAGATPSHCLDSSPLCWLGAHHWSYPHLAHGINEWSPGAAGGRLGWLLADGTRSWPLMGDAEHVAASEPPALEPILIGPPMRETKNPGSDAAAGTTAAAGGLGLSGRGPDDAASIASPLHTTDLHDPESVRIDREEVLQSWECLFALQHHTLAYSSGRLRRAEAARRNVATLQRLQETMVATRRRTRQVPLAELSYDSLLSRALASERGGPELPGSPPGVALEERPASGKRPPPPGRQRQKPRSASTTDVGANGAEEEVSGDAATTIPQPTRRNLGSLACLRPHPSVPA